MLTFLNGIKFIGDLSLQDADILAMLSKKSKNVLEFGCGGSTQIIAQCGIDTLISVDTDTRWVDITKSRLQQINTKASVQFVDYTTNFNQMFDLIFVDGIPKLREDFAIKTWQYLKEDGAMLFHDTRNFEELNNALSVIGKFHNEVYRFDTNTKASDGQSSNMSIIYKKKLEVYVNWNKTEGKPKWSYGSLDNPDLPLWEYKID